MFRATTVRLIACAALPLAIAGCDLDKLDVAQGAVTAAAAMAQPPLGHELFRMFEADKTAAGAVLKP